jgi:hypothetical protein
MPGSTSIIPSGEDTDVVFLKRFFTNKKEWDDVLKQWDIYDDAGSSVIYNWKPKTKSGGDVTMDNDAFAEQDKVS